VTTQGSPAQIFILDALLDDTFLYSHANTNENGINVKNMPGPIRRAIGRGAFRAAVGQGGGARRMARRIVRRTVRRVYRRRVMVGPAVVYAAAAGGAASVSPVKMSSADAQKIESIAGKPVEELTEEDLKAAMKRLGIQKIELTAEEQKQVSSPAQAEGDFECSECHAAVTETQKFCPSCGAELQ
jgi:hypothetical protein